MIVLAKVSDRDNPKPTLLLGLGLNYAILHTAWVPTLGHHDRDLYIRPQLGQGSELFAVEVNDISVASNQNFHSDEYLQRLTGVDFRSRRGRNRIHWLAAIETAVAPLRIEQGATGFEET